MSEEIKEIAESLREISTPTGLSYSGDRTLNNSYTEKIIDYITNLQQKVEQLEKENEQLRTQVNTYENPDDLTLFYMWLDEKAKDKIKQLENIRKEAIEYVNDNSLYEEEYDYDYEENIYLTGIDDEQAKKDLLNILNKGEKK